VRERVLERLGRLVRFVTRHQGVFWTLHSLWALSWGIAFLVVGAHRPNLLRFGLVSVGAVWLTSLALPAVLASSWIPEEREGAARKLVLWGQKYLLQALAFFLLPLYHGSATYPSRQILFMVCLALAALAATIDVVYDEVVSRHRPLFGVFLAFIAFACVNITAPMVWKVGGLWNLAASCVLATAVFVSFVAKREEGRLVRPVLRTAGVTLFFLALVTLGRPAVPPAPFRLTYVHFGTTLAPNGRDVGVPLRALPAASPVRLVAVAAILAPAGLEEGVRHVWSVDGSTFFEGRLIEITGGRERGFRSRSAASIPALRPGQRVRLDVETAHGQLIGRAEIEVEVAKETESRQLPGDAGR
jgi:hypothetical protein